MSSVDFLVKLRDAALMMADAANEYLETLGPKDAKTWTWNPDAVKWFEAEGSRGKYDRSEDVDSADFKSMVKDLADHKSKLSRAGFFYWLFESGSIVGRKKRKK